MINLAKNPIAPLSCDNLYITSIEKFCHFESFLRIQPLYFLALEQSINNFRSHSPLFLVRRDLKLCSHVFHFHTSLCNSTSQVKAHVQFPCMLIYNQ